MAQSGNSLDVSLLSIDTPRNNPSLPIRSASQINPPQRYYSLSQFFPPRQEEKKTLEAQIDNAEKELEPLMEKINKGIHSIPQTNIRKLLADTLGNDINNIPQLKEAISSIECSSLCCSKNCCLICTIPLIGAGLAGVVGVASTFIGSLFSATTYTTSHALVALEYGAIIGGGAGAIVSLVIYLKGFYDLVQLANNSSYAGVIAEKLNTLREELGQQIHNNLLSQKVTSPTSGLYDVSLE